MLEETIEGVRMNVTGDKNWTMNYLKSDVDQIISDYMGKKGGFPQSWQDLATFIDKHGEGEWHITPGEAVAMKEDVEEAMKHNVPSTQDRQKLYDDIHKFRHLHPNAPDKAKEEIYNPHHEGHEHHASGPSGNG